MAKKMSIGNGNGHLKNGQGRASTKSRQQRKKQVASASANGSISRTSAVIGVFFAALACLIVAAYQYYNPSVPTDDEPTRMSVILRNHANTAVQTIDQKNKFEAYILNDPLADVIKTKLRPVQERIASLKTQCAQYEKMKQIPGGPTKFIESSLHELNTDIEQKMFDLNAEALAILMDYVERGHAMVKAGIEMVNTGALRINSNHINMLTMEEVYFIPVGDVSAEELEKARQEVTLEQLVERVEELADMYERLEEADLKLLQVGNEVGINSSAPDVHGLSNEDYNKIVPYAMEVKEGRERIADFKEKNNKYLQVFQELTADQVRAMTAAMGQVRENDEKRRRPYLNLHMTIMKDIKNLKIRIDNLKYAYAKRRTTN